MSRSTSQIWFSREPLLVTGVSGLPVILPSESYATWLGEGLLLESALRRNRKLQNRRDTRRLQSITLSAFINAKPGRPTHAARRLAQVIHKDAA